MVFLHPRWAFLSALREIAMKSTMVVIGSLLLVGAATPALSQQQEDATVESIHVVRSLRLSRSPASDYCESKRTGFEGAKFEDTYEFRVVVTRPSDGMVTDASSSLAGTIHACFGPGSEPTITHFFGEGSLGSVKFSGKGDCRQIRKNFPEQGIVLYRCYLDFDTVSGGYVGGLLTTNTVTTRQTIGQVSDPPGYIQPSIATVRLWRARAQ